MDFRVCGQQRLQFFSRCHIGLPSQRLAILRGSLGKFSKRNQCFGEVQVRGGKFRSQPEGRFKTVRGIRPALVLQKENTEVVLGVGITGIVLRGGGEMFKGLIVQAKEDEAQAEVVLAVGVTRFDAHGLAIQHEGANVVALHFIHFAEGVGGDVIIPGHVQRVEEQPARSRAGRCRQ